MQEVQRTLYFSHYEPMLVVPQFGAWSLTRALTYRDANSENGEVITQFLEMNLAASMDDFQRVYAEVSGIPWVNTMSAAADGRVWYADDGPRATSIAAYSQSKDPDSPHYADQTQLYSMEQFKLVRFTEEDITSDPQLEVVVIRSN